MFDGYFDLRQDFNLVNIISLNAQYFSQQIMHSHLMDSSVLGKI